MPFVWLIYNIFFPPDPEKNLRIQKTQGGSYSVTNAHHEMIVPRGLELRNRKTPFRFCLSHGKNPCQVIVKSSEKMPSHLPCYLRCADRNLRGLAT